MHRFFAALLGFAFVTAMPAAAKDGATENPYLEDLLAAVRLEIDDVQTARDALAADPENIVIIRRPDGLSIIDRRDVAAGSLLAAALLHEIVSSSPTAASMINEQLGETVGTTLRGAGVNRDVAGFAGWAVSRLSEAINAQSTLLTEERLLTEITTRVDTRLADEALTLQRLDEDLTILWALHDTIEAALRGETEAPSNSGPSGIEGWTVSLATYDVEDGALHTVPAGDGQTSYYIAPGRFLGDWSGLTELTFELMSEGGTYYPPNDYGADGDVVITGAGGVLRIDIADNHGAGWTAITVPLQGGTTTGGTAAEILSNVTELRIRAEYGVGADSSALRNPVLQ